MQKTNFLFDVEKIEQDINAREIGGKAFNLYKVSRLGLQIPKTLVIPTYVFDDLIKNPEVLNILGNINFDNLFDAVSELEQLLITATPHIKEQIIDSISAYADLLKFNKLAIRSSANVEDGIRFSFAGQFDSMLNVKPEIETITDAIIYVYKSVFTVRSLSYCLANEIDPRDISMAVIIQDMIASQYAGTSFTKDISSNASDEIIIESTAEEGSKVVDGSGLTNIYRFAKNNIIKAKGPSYIKNLAKLSLGLEAEYQLPQDIEWAFDGEQLFILQTRAITT